MLVKFSQLCYLENSAERFSFIISAVFYGARNIKMDYSISLTILNFFLQFASIFHTSYCRKYFLSSAIRGSKLWDSLIFVKKAFSKFLTEICKDIDNLFIDQSKNIKPNLRQVIGFMLLRLSKRINFR